MAQLDFAAFDADHHYYEAEDAFTRHIERRMQPRCMQWAEIGGKKRLLVGGKLNRFIPNPTFDPVSRPGALDEYFRGRNPEGKDMAALFGRLDPIHPAYRDRDARLAQIDQQGLEGALLFPTLAVGMEEALKHDPQACMAAFRAFNRWLLDDWSFDYRGRLLAAPYIVLMDVDHAIAELEFALAHGARLVCMRAAPIQTAEGPTSPGDARYDPFWARVDEAGIAVMYHSGDAGQNEYAASWGEGGDLSAFEYRPLRSVLSVSPVRDTLAALICHGVFDRHPNLRVATIESGSEWAFPLLKALRKAHGQMPHGFERDPVEAFKRHVWISPYYEDDLERLRHEIGAERVLFGSDFPHAEGLAVPTDFIHDLKGYDESEIRLVMRENVLELARPRPRSRS
jgi:predicted TIM-barrel fold metal-dependent hydrolase